MGIINQGILGGVRGKVGNVVGGGWKGIDWLRVRVIPTNPQTAAQVLVRQKMAKLIGYARFNKESVIDLGFGKKVKGKPLSATNQFVKEGMLDLDWETDLFKLPLSNGILQPIPILSAIYYEDTQKLYVTIDPAVTGYGSPDDKMVMFTLTEDESPGAVYIDKDDNDTRTTGYARAGSGMYKILSSKMKASMSVFTYAFRADGEVSNTTGLAVDIQPVDPN